MRIAVINRTFARRGGGAEAYAVAIVQELAPQHDIHVFSQQTDQPVPGVTYHQIFRLCEKPRWINQLLFALFSWWRTRRGFDVVHSHENTWHGQVQTVHVWPTRHNLFHGRHGWRLVLAWLKVLTSPRLLTYVWLEGARFRHRPGRQVVAASAMLRDACLEAYPQAKISVITPGVHMPELIRSQNEARQKLGISQSVPWLLFVANDFARKGLDTVLQALTLLPNDLHLAVVGSSHQIPVYQNKVDKMGLTARVRFLGPLEDVTPAYQAADVLVHPTLEDSYAMVVLEAMANRLPVVVSGPAYCGISHDLTDGREALLLEDPRDEKQLAKLIGRLLNEPTLIQLLKERGLDFASTHSWASSAQEYDTLYRLASSK
ncbi:MAG: glycosyltransferase family 4 protein [Hylemonella sp.]